MCLNRRNRRRRRDPQGRGKGDVGWAGGERTPARKPPFLLHILSPTCFLQLAGLQQRGMARSNLCFLPLIILHTTKERQYKRSNNKRQYKRSSNKSRNLSCLPMSLCLPCRSTSSGRVQPAKQKSRKFP